MKYKLKIIPVLIIILFLALLTFSFLSKQTTNTNNDLNNLESNKQNTNQTEKLNNIDENEINKKNYFVYSREAYVNAKNQKRVLFFYASWCPTCRPADAEFSSNIDEIPSDVVIFRINYNDPETDQVEKDLAKKYQITYQHTFVQVDESDQTVKKWNGGGLAELKANLK